MNKPIITPDEVLAVDQTLTQDEVDSVILECEDAHDNCENCGATLKSAIDRVVAERDNALPTRVHHGDVVLRPDVVRVEYDYAVVKNQGVLEMGESAQATQKELLEAFKSCESGVKAIKAMNVGHTILLPAEIPDTDPDNDSTSVVNVVIASRWTDELKDMKFMHSSDYGMMNEVPTPRDLYQLWEDDPTFMDGGEGEIIKLRVGETLIRKDSSGYINVTTRTE